MFCRDVCNVKHGIAGVTISVLYCNSWQCEVCQGRRAWKLAQDLKAGKPSKFLTLTVAAKRGISREQRARSLKDAWVAWIAKLRREHPGEVVEYAYVFEDTEKGEPHMHILGRWPWVDKAEISAYFGKKIGAPNTRIEAVKSQKGLASYLTDYLKKGPTRFGTLKRYGFSKGYRIRKRVKEAIPKVWQGHVTQVDQPYHLLQIDYFIKGFRQYGEAPPGFCRLLRPQPKPPDIWRLDSGLLTRLSPLGSRP